MHPNPFPELRNDFLLDPEITFLNHGSFGATPKPVFETYQHWQRELERQPVEFLGRRATSLLAESRAALAAYLGTDRDNLVYVTNATTGLNIIARSLRLGPGDIVLTSNHEYGALDRTFRFLSQEEGFTYQNHPLPHPLTTAEAFVNSFWQAVTPATRVIFLSHITSPTALIFPVKEICRRAREQGILTIIDGAHVPGQIPLCLDDLGADFYSGNLHKWLCAPKGAAFLYARPAVQHLVKPLVVSWGWQSEQPGPSRFIDEQEWTGTRDISAFLAVPAAINYHTEHNWAVIQGWCHAMAAETQQLITKLTDLPPLHTDTSFWFSQMATARLPDSTDIVTLKHRLYAEYRIEVPLIDWNGFKLVRFSFQAFNREEDGRILRDALARLL